MSITFKVSDVKKSSNTFKDFQFKEILKEHPHQDLNENGNRKLLLSSELNNAKCCRHTNSFVFSAYIAYSDHYHLVIRPEDVWMAIMVQFSSYINKNSEALRDKFVDFQGKKELTVRGYGTLATARYDELALKMTDEIAKNIKDPSVKEWCLPNFTTTTSTDKVVGAIALMASMKQFFSFKFSLMCGLPEVTLKGTIGDWQEIKNRIQKLTQYDLDGKIKEWVNMLIPISDQFIKTASGEPDKEWWNQIANHVGGGSGPTYLSGWITAFCVFNDKGVWQNKKSYQGFGQKKAIETPWIFVDTQDVPSGYLSVPVTIDDNGTEYKSEMFSGHMAIDSSPGVMSPRLDWCIFLVNN